MKNIYTFEQYQGLIEKLATNIYAQHGNTMPYDQLLCLARGGMMLGDAFSRIFKIPLAVLFTSSYRINQHRGQLFIDNQIAKQTNQLGGKILVLDDLVDSGLTLKGVVDNIQTNYNPTLIHTAVIWKKECSKFTPDFFAAVSPAEEWIVQPFESFDDFSIDDACKAPKA